MGHVMTDTTNWPGESSSLVSIRPPSQTQTNQMYNQEDATHVPPTAFIEGKWHVTHSSLPMWKKARNVSITYTVMSEDDKGRPSFDNLVEYQSLKSSADSAIKTVKGTEAPLNSLYGAWRWRGKGWLMIASSDWEILGYGHSSLDSSPVIEKADGAEEALEARRLQSDWVVTYFASTLFTPSGIDIYCRKREGLKKNILDEIVRVLKNDGGDEVKKLAAQLFEVKRTGA